MSLIDQPSLLVSIQNWLQRSDISAQFVDFITLFETAANRRLRVRQQELSVILTPLMTATVTGAAASPTGLVRLTVPTAGITSGDTVVVTNVLGTTEANGTWPVNLPDISHIDLIGTTFANAYVSGGTVTDTGSVPLPADFLAWRKVIWLGQPNRNLDWCEPAYFSAEYPDIPQDIPSIFTIEGSTLKVMPQDKTPIQLLYWQKIPALTASNTTNWLMTAHPDLYLFGSLAEAGAYARNADDVTLWKARRDELFDEIDKLDKKARGPSRVRVMSPTP